MSDNNGLQEAIDEIEGQSQELDISEIPETDILFECPHCGKSLSIDQKGAGLVIRCTQCKELVSVPIPEGMQLDDFDATPEELSSQLLHTRQTLAKVEAERDALQEELVELRAVRNNLRQFLELRAENTKKMAETLTEVQGLQAGLNQQLDLLTKLTETALALETPNA